MTYPIPAPVLQLIDLKNVHSKKAPRHLPGGLIGPAEYLLAIDKINAVHRSLPAELSVGDFSRHSLKALNIEYALT